MTENARNLVKTCNLIEKLQEFSIDEALCCI